MLDPRFDQLKSQSQIQKEFGKTCNIPGCTNPLTLMQGPGSGTLCREHQLKLREYGGMGRIDRKHTFHRKRYCEECGYNPWEDASNPYYYLKDTDPTKWDRMCRNKLIGDHQTRKTDGGEDTEENTKTLCLNCNSDKTIFNEDFRPSKKSQMFCVAA